MVDIYIYIYIYIYLIIIRNSNCSKDVLFCYSKWWKLLAGQKSNSRDSQFFAEPKKIDTAKFRHYLTKYYYLTKNVSRERLLRQWLIITRTYHSCTIVGFNIIDTSSVCETYFGMSKIPTIFWSDAICLMAQIRYFLATYSTPTRALNVPEYRDSFIWIECRPFFY